MKILILGPLGAGKSTLAYKIQKKYKIARLNIDEICRDKKTGEYYAEKQQIATLAEFLQANSSWVMEGCQKYLYERTEPDFIVYINVSRWVAAWRFTLRFFKAKKLIGKEIAPDLPVQAYHYRKPTLKKILEWNKCNGIINSEIREWLKDKNNCYIIKNNKDVVSLLQKIDLYNSRF